MATLNCERAALLLSFVVVHSLSAPALGSEYLRKARHNISVWKHERFLQTQLQYQALDDREPGGLRVYDQFEPIISCPPNSPLRSYGTKGPGADGSKWLCSLRHLESPCVVYSFGGENDNTFEADILDTTPCTVYTFDCTVNTPPTLLGPRHQYGNFCIGSTQQSSLYEGILTYHQIQSIYGHSKVDVLKIDIESCEWQVFAEWTRRSSNLPMMIATELHFIPAPKEIQNAVFNTRKAPENGNYKFFWGRRRLSLSDISMFFLHMAELGYGAFAKELNTKSQCCSEYSFLNIYNMAAAAAAQKHQQSVAVESLGSMDSDNKHRRHLRKYCQRIN